MVEEMFSGAAAFSFIIREKTEVAGVQKGRHASK